jgi:hypothetical protein
MAAGYLTAFGVWKKLLVCCLDFPGALAELLAQADMDTSNNNHDTAICVSVVFAIAFVWAFLLIISYKKGKILNGYVRRGKSPFVDRRLEPYGYWPLFIIHSLICVFAAGFGIFALIHGVH